MQRLSEAKLIVHDTLADNVLVDVNGARKMTDAIVCGVVFVEHKGELEATGL
jgi:hypothetical protein